MGNQAYSTFPMQKLLSLLPLYAEEGRQREVVSEADLAARMGKGADGELALVRRIFESFALLDNHELSRGNWAFVSFPASLMARSLVAAWAVPEQRFVEEGYWESDGDNPSIAEEQRTLLHALETGRKRFHPTGNALPIRFVHVAWGIIRMGNEFLLHHREDKPRPDAKQYVLPGGRMRPSDCGDSFPAILGNLASENSIVAEKSLPKTLIRELDEELGLHDEEDYTFEPWKSIRPYCAVGGGGSKHALTRYEISLYLIKLTSLGETRLLNRVATDTKQYLWFSLEDLVQGKRADGATAFIDALHEDMADGFKERFESIPEASGTPYTFSTENMAIDLPAGIDRPFIHGKTGKERDVLVPINDFEWELIIFLGWCARGFAVHPVSDCALVLGGGWVKLFREEDITAAKEAARKFYKKGLPLFQFSGDVLRLSIKPEYTCFSAGLFSYAYVALSTGAGQVDLYLKEITTRFANLVGQSVRFRVPANIANVIEIIHAGKSTSTIPAITNAGDIQKQNLDTVTKEVKRLGLRRLIKMPNNDDMSIVVARV